MQQVDYCNYCQSLLQATSCSFATRAKHPLQAALCMQQQAASLEGRAQFPPLAWLWQALLTAPRDHSSSRCTCDLCGTCSGQSQCCLPNAGQKSNTKFTQCRVLEAHCGQFVRHAWHASRLPVSTCPGQSQCCLPNAGGAARSRGPERRAAQAADHCRRARGQPQHRVHGRAYLWWVTCCGWPGCAACNHDSAAVMASDDACV